MPPAQGSTPAVTAAGKPPRGRKGPEGLLSRGTGGRRQPCGRTVRETSEASGRRVSAPAWKARRGACGVQARPPCPAALS